MASSFLKVLESLMSFPAPKALLILSAFKLGLRQFSSTPVLRRLLELQDGPVWLLPPAQARRPAAGGARRPAAGVAVQVALIESRSSTVTARGGH